MKKNNFMFSDMKIIRKNDVFIVETMDITIRIKISDVYGINSKVSDETEENIVVFLACIEQVRKITNLGCKKNQVEKSLDINKIADTLSILLKCGYTIEFLSDFIRDLKWHEIKKIILCENPIEEVNKII